MLKGQGPTVAHVKIKNMNTFPIRDMHDSISYVFLPGREVTVPMVAATHMFGFHLEATEKAVFDHISRRLGWNRPDNAEQARQYFNNISIRPVIFRVVEEPVEDHEYAKEAEQAAAEGDGEPRHIDFIPAKPGRKKAGESG